jgi:pyridoxal phosphate enzyme (YggS family)
MLTFYTMGIAEALKLVEEKINKSALKVGRSPKDIKLVAVSKTVELDRILTAVKAGISILGENRIQEAKEKILHLKSRMPLAKVEWHLVGNLQKNKAKTAVQLFDLIHSLDSVRLAEILNECSKKAGKAQRVLIQVKLAEEPTKHGVPEAELMFLLEKVCSMKQLQVEGLMIMPPFFENPEDTRPYFKKLFQIADETKDRGYPLNELSMGMSHDFEIAVEEGATMVRIGTEIFGKRYLG